MPHGRGMTEPTTYEITLRGNVGARSLRPLVDDFEINQSERGITRLIGIIRDPSQMYGLVAHLASMGVELVAIVPTGGHGHTAATAFDDWGTRDHTSAGRPGCSCSSQ